MWEEYLGNKTLKYGKTSHVYGSEELNCQTGHTTKSILRSCEISTQIQIFTEIKNNLKMPMEANIHMQKPSDGQTNPA